MRDYTPLRLEPLPPVPTTDARRVLTRRIAAVLVGVIVLALGFAVVVVETDSVRGLRLSTVSTRTVERVVREVGVIEAVSAVGVGFPVQGTVASVNVTTGMSVTRGQVLATLDTTELQRAVNAAQGALDQAIATLAETAPPVVAPAPTVPDSADELAAARQAVLDGQQNVDDKLSVAQAELDSATAICEAVTDGNVEQCRNALTGVLAAQRETAEAQRSLADDARSFDALVSAAAGTPRVIEPTIDRRVSAADLVVRQKAVDAAQLGVAVAKQALAAATIVSPMDGTVQAIQIAVGAAVLPVPNQPAVKIVGTGGFEVTAVMGANDLAEVRVGQPASIRPDGSSREVAGEVVAIGSPVTTDNNTTYPVSIGIDDSEDLRNGTVASVAITTESAESVVAVPTSALRIDGDQATVTTRTGTTKSSISVTVGVIGPEWTEVTRGLRVGQRVVLADLSEPLPGAATRQRPPNNRP